MPNNKRPTPQCEQCGNAFASKGYARYCPDCRYNARPRRRSKYPLTADVKRLLEDRYDSTRRGRVAEIASLLDWPPWQVKRVAQRLGLARPAARNRRAWTDDEVALLQRWQGLRSAHWIAKKLQRGETAVALKFSRLGLSRRVRMGYSARDLARAMGVDGHVVIGWSERGLLAAGRRGSTHPSDWYQIAEADVVAFLREYREAYDLRKVDQEWFLRLAFDSIVEAAPNTTPDPTPAEIERRKAEIRRSNGHAVPT